MSSTSDPLGAFNEKEDLLFCVGWTRSTLIASRLPSLTEVAKLPLPGLEVADDVKYVSDECVAVTSHRMTGGRGGSAYLVYIVDVSQYGSLKLVRSLPLHTGQIRRVRVLECPAAASLADSASGRLCVTVSSDKTLNCWGAGDGKSKFVVNDGFSLHSVAELPWIDCVAIAGGASTHIRADYPAVRIYDIETQSRVHDAMPKTCPNSSAVYAMEKHIERKLVLAGSMAHFFRAYDVRAAMTPVWCMEMRGLVICIRSAPDTNIIVMRTENGKMIVLDERKLGLSQSLDSSPAKIRTFNPHTSQACNSCDILRLSETVWSSSCHGGPKGTSLWTMKGKVLRTQNVNGEGLEARCRWCDDRRFCSGGGSLLHDPDWAERFEYVRDSGVVMRRPIRVGLRVIDGLSALLVSL